MDTGQQSPDSPAAGVPEVPPSVHWWNFWVCGSEAALYITAVRIMGPLTLIPFLFRQVGLNDAWLGLFTMATMVMAVGGPIGTALAGGRRRRLGFCVKTGVFQRLPFLMVPLGAMFLFDSPALLLWLLVAAWLVTHLFAGMGYPVFQVLTTSGIRESWWARMMSLRNILGAALSFAATVFVWWVNRDYAAPMNYVILGWLGVALVTASLFVVMRIREVPMAHEQPHGWPVLAATFRRILSIIRLDGRVRWLALGRVFRSFGFLLGTYMTPLMIARCGLTDEQMWIPVIVATVSQILSHAISGWFVDHVGAKPALVISSLVVAGNSVFITYSYSLPAFVLVFVIGSIGGSLLMTAWPTLILKLAPVEQRSVYMTTLSVAAEPGSFVVLLAGMFLVRFTEYEFVFYASALGALIGAVIFYIKLPHIRRAP